MNSVDAASVSDECTSRKRWIAWVAIACLGGQGLAIASQPKTHTLFMGVDVAVERDGQRRPIVDVGPQTITIGSGGKRIDVSHEEKLSFHVTESLKIAENRVGIAELKAKRAYTPEKDPFRQFTKAVAAANAQAAVEESQAFVNLREAARAQEAGASINGVSGDVLVEQATQAYDAQLNQRTLGDIGAHGDRFQQSQADQMFDAIQITFEVTPDKDLVRPYFVVVAQYREHGAKTTGTHKWIYTRPIGPLAGRTSRRMFVYQGGFPPGYELASYNLHVYDQGQELVTNVSRKRVELTADEVCDFRVIEYVGANKGQTVPAALIATSVADGLREQMRSLSQKGLYVRVTKEGRVKGLFHDAAGKRPFEDKQLGSAIKALRFMPSLQAGRPIDAAVRLEWPELSP